MLTTERTIDLKGRALGRHRILEGCQQVDNAERSHVGGVSGKSGESHMVCRILSPVTR